VNCKIKNRILLILVSVLIVCFSNSYAQWEWKWHHPYPQGNYLWDLWVFDDENVIVVGAHNTIIRTKDGGITWRMINFEQNLLGFSGFGDLVFTTPDTGWMVAKHGAGSFQGQAFQTIDGGVNIFGSNPGYDVFKASSPTIKAELNLWLTPPAVNGWVDISPQYSNLLCKNSEPYKNYDEYFIEMYQLLEDSLYDDAIKLLEKLARDVPDDSVVIKVVFNLRKIYTELDQLVKFEKDLRKYVKKYPDELLGEIAFRFCVLTLLRNNKAHEALEWANDLIDKYERKNKNAEETAWLVYDRIRILEYIEENKLSKSSFCNKENDIDRILTEFSETGAADLVCAVYHREKIESGKQSTVAGINQPVMNTKNYPNPFNPSTTIYYELKSESNVEITIYNMMGEVVENLKNQYEAVGSYQVVWDGTNQHGLKVANGFYFYRIKTDQATVTKKMLMLK